jgi:hypothetical protein
MAKNSLLITIVSVVTLGVLGFFGGMQYQKSQATKNPQGINQGLPGGPNQPRRTGAQRNAMVGRPISGEITSLDDKTITVKTQNGDSKIVVYSTSTKVNKTAEGVISDLAVGEQVMVLGQESSDGTLTAQSISLGQNMFPGRAATDQPTPSVTP